MTLFSRISRSVIALVAIIAMLGVFAVMQVDQNQYKDRIEQFILDQTGRDLQINGEVSARLFPWFGLSLTDISMSNTDEFTVTEFASVQSGDFQIAALPLLAGKLQIKTVVLNELSLKLQRDADGKTNWDDLMATTSVVETESDDNVMREVEAGAPIIAALSVGGLQINNSNISYSDGRDETYVALNELNLETGTVVLSEPFAFDSSFSVISSAAAGMTSTVRAKGEIAVDLVNNIYTLQQVRLSTINSGDTLPVDPLILSANGQLIADLNAENVTITITDGLFTGIPISGEFAATGLTDNLRMTGVLSSGEFDAAPVMDQLGFENTGNFQMDLLESAQVSARFEHTQEVLQISDFNVSASDVNLKGDFQIANPRSSAVLSGWIQTTPFNPAPWARGFGFEVEDDSVLRMAQFSADVRQSGQLLSFNQIDLQLDDSNITGSVEFSDIRADNLPLAYALSVDQINLDAYLQTPTDPAQDTAEDSVPATVSNTSQTTRTLPVDALRKLDIEGELTVGEVTLAGVTARNAVLPLVARNNKIEIAEASADLYSGTFFSTASLNVQPDEPLLIVTGNITGLDAGALLQDAMVSEVPLTGTANLSVDVLSRGSEWSQLLAQSSGALSLQVADGQLTGIDIASELLNAGNQIDDNASVEGTSVERTSVEGTSVEGTATEQQAPDPASVTGFSDYSLSAVVSDGIFKIDDLVFLSPDLQVTGVGGVDINTHSVDYLLHLKLDAEVEDTRLQRFAGMEMAIPVRGPFTDVSMDLPRVFKSAFRAGLIQESKSRYTTSSDSQQVNVAERIEAQKEALRLRLEKQQQQAATINQELQPAAEITSQESELTRKLAREKAIMKQRLRDNLEKDSSEQSAEGQVKP